MSLQIDCAHADAIAALMPFASPAASRNAVPLAHALAPELPDKGVVLEVASGSGFHAAVLALHFPHITWQPTEADPARFPPMEDLVQEASLENLKAPCMLDAAVLDWPVADAEAILCLNMIHISPWVVAEGLMQGAGRILKKDGALFLYGPFTIDGVHTAPSNVMFDESLRDKNPDWGVRNSIDVDHAAGENGLTFERFIEMPANNMIRIYRK